MRVDVISQACRPGRNPPAATIWRKMHQAVGGHMQYSPEHKPQRRDAEASLRDKSQPTRSRVEVHRARVKVPVIRCAAVAGSMPKKLHMLVK